MKPATKNELETLERRVKYLEDKMDLFYLLLGKIDKIDNLDMVKQKLIIDEYTDIRLFTKKCCELLSISYDDILSSKKGNDLPRYRRILYKLITDSSIKSSVTSIGRALNKNHATVIFHLERIKHLKEDMIVVNNVKSKLNKVKKEL